MFWFIHSLHNEMNSPGSSFNFIKLSCRFAFCFVDPFLLIILNPLHNVLMIDSLKLSAQSMEGLGWWSRATLMGIPLQKGGASTTTVSWEPLKECDGRLGARPGDSRLLKDHRPLGETVPWNSPQVAASEPTQTLKVAGKTQASWKTETVCCSDVLILFCLSVCLIGSPSEND